jgi:hypothetical protein
MAKNVMLEVRAEATKKIPATKSSRDRGTI